MPSTPTYGLRYQSLSDPPDGPNLGRLLAEDVEAQIARLDGLLGARGIMADPLVSAAFGTATAANTTEVRDAVMGDYQFVSAGTSRRYKVCYPTRLSIFATGSNNLVSARVRMSNSGTPTTASTLILDKVCYLPTSGGGGQIMHDFFDEFTCSAGTWTLSTFLVGNGTVTTPVPTRKLWVEDIGLA